MNYQRPVITADIIVWRKIDDTAKVCLIKRGKPPFEGYFALPGGHFDVETDISIKYAAIRELKEELNIDAANLIFYNYFDAPGRDPRGRYVDFVFLLYQADEPTVKAGDDAADYAWVDINDLDLLPLAFDHRAILEEFVKEMLCDSLCLS